MKKIKIEDAVGRVLGHDVTQIIPEEYKICLLPKRGGRTKSRREDIG